jgi:hypothetical protein
MDLIRTLLGRALLFSGVTHTGSARMSRAASLCASLIQITHTCLEVVAQELLAADNVAVSFNLHLVSWISLHHTMAWHGLMTRHEP